MIEDLINGLRHLKEVVLSTLVTVCKQRITWERYVVNSRVCNPPFAYKALQAEDKIGTMLPCNVIVQEISAGKVEVTAIDPLASMQAIENPALKEIAAEISNKLKTVIDRV